MVSKTIDHKKIINAWEKLGCGISALPNEKSITKNIHLLLQNNFQLARRFSQNGKKIIDGYGAKRLAQKILSNNNFH